MSTPEHRNFAELFERVADQLTRRPLKAHPEESLVDERQSPLKASSALTPQTDRLAVRASDADFEALAPQKRKHRAHPTPEDEDRKTEMVVTFRLWASHHKLRRLRQSRQRWRGLFLLRTVRRMRDLRFASL